MHDTGERQAGVLTQVSAEVSADIGKSEEQKQEALLKQKYGNLPAKKGSSQFIQNRLQHRKFFDSADYNKDKQKQHPKLPPTKASALPAHLGGGGHKPQLPPMDPVCAAPAGVPKPKPSPPAAPALNISAPADEGGRLPLSPTAEEPQSGSSDERESGTRSPTGMEIPRPDTVPQRKSSIIQVGMASKLSPQPIHHHIPQDPIIDAITDVNE